MRARKRRDHRHHGDDQPSEARQPGPTATLVLGAGASRAAPRDVMSLQRAAGNRAVVSWIEAGRREATPPASGPGLPVQRAVAKLAGPGGKVRCFYPGSVDIGGSEALIQATGTGATPLHQSKKMSNPPDHMAGYIHNYSLNRIFAVRWVNPVKRWVHILAQGHVKSGMHIFD
jgi:hypothetical protein